MKLWKNTNTLDKLVPELLATVDPSVAEVAVIGGKSIDLSQFPNLKAIFKCGVGVDNVPFEEAKKRNIDVIFPSENTKKFIFEETANFAVHLIIQALYRDLGSVENWEKKKRVFLGKKKVLILGQGNIGKLVATKLIPLVEVLTYDPIENPEDHLESLFKQADVVTLHIPLLEETKCFVDKEKLSWMKDGSTLINTARGSLVNEEHLYQEIKNKRIFAAFDVFWQEPYTGILQQYHPGRFFMTPHVASNCSNFLDGLADDFYKSIS